MNTKEIGRILGYLVSAYEASHEIFVKRRIEDAILELSKLIEEKENYRELIEGIIEAKVPLRLLTSVCRFLPGQPILAEVAGRAEGFFVKEEEGIKTIVGINEAGKLLVNTMIAAVRERATKQSQKPENHRNKK